jgi:hypothetical protein
VRDAKRVFPGTWRAGLMALAPSIHTHTHIWISRRVALQLLATAHFAVESQDHGLTVQFQDSLPYSTCAAGPAGNLTCPVQCGNKRGAWAPLWLVHVPPKPCVSSHNQVQRQGSNRAPLGCSTSSMRSGAGSAKEESDLPCDPPPIDDCFVDIMDHAAPSRRTCRRA